jgi:hypothetical protein
MCSCSENKELLEHLDKCQKDRATIDTEPAGQPMEKQHRGGRTHNRHNQLSNVELTQAFMTCHGGRMI